MSPEIPRIYDFLPSSIPSIVAICNAFAFLNRKAEIWAAI